MVEEVIEEVTNDGEPPAKTSKIQVLPQKTTETKKESWNRSIGVMAKKSTLVNLVKNKKVDSIKTDVNNQKFKIKEESPVNNEDTTETKTKDTCVNNETGKTKLVTSGLSLLANYSGSDSDS